MEERISEWIYGAKLSNSPVIGRATITMTHSSPNDDIQWFHFHLRYRRHQMHTLLLLLAAFGLAFALKESVLFDRPRIWLIGRHPFFGSLFDCYACVGFWASLAVFLLDQFAGFIGSWIIFGLAGSAACLLLNLLIDRLTVDHRD
jgi:hypothetical protein